MELRVIGPARNLRGNIRVPGDKSISHRALLLGSMARGHTRLQGLLRAGVTQCMEDCLRRLGVQIEHIGTDLLVVHGQEWRAPAAALDCGNSGTTMRLLMGALAGSTVSATLAGSSRLSQRPMGRVAEPLRQMGARISSPNDDDQPPLSIIGSVLHGIDYMMPVPSAQVKTAILLAGLRAAGFTHIHEPAPSRDHTERLFRHLGVLLRRADHHLTLRPLDRILPSFDLRIPGDFSAAVFPMAAGLLSAGSELQIHDVGLNPTRVGLMEVLVRMGAQLQAEVLPGDGPEPIGNVTVRSGELKGVEVAGDQVVSMIDEFPIFFVIATQAHGRTRVRGASELRLKESDRLATMTTELRKMGAQIEPHPDGLTIAGPTRLRGATVHSHADHRVAMALAVAGAAAQGETRVLGAEVFEQSYPDLPQTLHSLGVELT